MTSFGEVLGQSFGYRIPAQREGVFAVNWQGSWDPYQPFLPAWRRTYVHKVGTEPIKREKGEVMRGFAGDVIGIAGSVLAGYESAQFSQNLLVGVGVGLATKFLLYNTVANAVVNKAHKI